MNVSRTVWTTFHCRGTTSKVSMTVSPSLASVPPQHKQAPVASMTTRFARQVPGQRRAHRLATCERRHRRGLRGRGCRRLARCGFQFLELQLHLVEQLAAMLGGRAEAVMAELGDHQLQVRDHRLGARGACFGLPPGRALGQQRRLQRFDVVRERFGAGIHGGNRIAVVRSRACRICTNGQDYPAVSGRQVRCGWRQSMPSSM